MVLEVPLGGVTVAGQDRVDDRLVLAQGARHPVAQAQLQAAVGLEPVVQLARLLGQEAVVAGLVDHVVEALVGVVVGVGVPAPALARAGLVRLDQGAALALGDPPRCQPAAHALERRHRLDPLDDLLEAQRGDERAPALPQRDQPGRRELHQRLADRRPGDPEARRQSLLVEPLAGPERAGDDVLLELVPQRIRAPHVDAPPWVDILYSR